MRKHPLDFGDIPSTARATNGLGVSLASFGSSPCDEESPHFYEKELGVLRKINRHSNPPKDMGMYNIYNNNKIIIIIYIYILYKFE